MTFLVAALLFLTTPFAEAYTQDRALEAGLARGDPQSLALLPARGYKDGAAGFFKGNELYVVPDSVRAWCHERTRGVLEPGCYVEFYFQAKGRRGVTADGSPCGLPARWHRAPGAKSYGATPGAFYSLAIARGDWEAIILAFGQRPLAARLSDVRRVDECDAGPGR